MSQSFAKKFSDAPVDPTYITQTSNSTLTNEQALSSLSTGYLRVTTGTGVITSQAVPILISQGGTGNTSLTANGILSGNGASAINITSAGASTTLLRGQTGASPIFGQGVLTTDVGSSVLPISNGGTNNSTTYTAGSIIFSDGTKLTQDNANFFWDNIGNNLLIGGTTTSNADIILGADGSAVFNKQNTLDKEFRIHGSAATHLVWGQAGAGGDANKLYFGTNSTNHWLTAGAGSIPDVFISNGTVPIRIAGQTQNNLIYADTVNGRLGIRTSSPTTSLHIAGGLSLPVTTKTANFTATNSNFCILANPATTLTITLPAASNTGLMIMIKKIGGTAVTISPGIGDTIEGSATIVLANNNSSRLLTANGSTDWKIIASIGA